MVALVVLTVGHLVWTSRYSLVSGRFEVRKDVAFIPRVCTGQTCEHFLAPKVPDHVEPTYISESSR